MRLLSRGGLEKRRHTEPFVRMATNIRRPPIMFAMVRGFAGCVLAAILRPHGANLERGSRSSAGKLLSRHGSASTCRIESPAEMVI
ncbi:hypothetical protein; putative signal peptide [Frankia alni ACN14a]|uniref:Uncharacterized protein n=1 Tax=Frankia alni (strain DSM 45986 / CECT 9034 / ACN14a) TaxID=326424 RepID=Q0RQ05_FRAAA|nr:hypothetical protein; putative signal peptide [Frankia alni ACN14a]